MDTGWPRCFSSRYPVEIEEKHITKKECCPKKPLLLVCGGGDGIFPYRKVGEELKKLKIPSTVVMLSGTSRRKFNTTSRQHDMHVLPFTDYFKQYLHAADHLISKAGGMAMEEAVLCEVSIVLYSPFPGIEEYKA